MHDFSILRALFSDSISLRFSAWQVKDAPGTTTAVAVCGCELSCTIRIRGHSASGTNTNTNAMSKDECANGEVAVTLFFKICRHFFKLIFKKKIIP